MTKLSVIVPVYNKEMYVKKCIESILMWGDDYEIIIVDDGSTDESAKIIDGFSLNEKIKVIHKKNGGADCPMQEMQEFFLQQENT